MFNPLIGVTVSHGRNQRGLPTLVLMEAYSQALIQAGAIPVMIPLHLPDEALRTLVERLDGILFSGGGDVEPWRYDSQPHPKVSGTEPERDRVEILLAQAGVQADLPMLGICRGLQVINVALGGSLYEDILDQHPGAIRHQYSGDHPRNYLAHSVQVQADSQLASILGCTSTGVNSLHHQGIRQLASGMQTSAQAPDGLIEAVEIPGLRFALAVQWHPEWMLEHVSMQALFKAFVEEARKK